MATLASHNIFQKYGFFPTYITYLAQNHFVLADHFKPLFRIYQYREMTGQQVLDAIKQGTIIFNDVVFQVIFKNTSRGKLILNPEALVHLSFRAPQLDIQELVYPVVIVSANMNSAASEVSSLSVS